MQSDIIEVEKSVNIKVKFAEIHKKYYFCQAILKVWNKLIK